MICAAMLAICLPTYNERENLEPMVRALGEVLAGAGSTAACWSSTTARRTGRASWPTGSPPSFRGSRCCTASARKGWARRTWRRFGTCSRATPTSSLEMDCDFSHDPADVPRLVAATESADLAIGSRYVEGGQVRNWGRIRRAISRGGCRYAQAILGFGVRDSTAGFRCFRREVLETIALDRIHSKGYAFQIETTYRAVRAGFGVTEIPITFAERTEGRSKMSRGIVLEAVWKVPSLRLAAALRRL